MRMLQEGGGMMGGAPGMPEPDAPKPDTAETVHISSLALLKMLKHGRAGVVRLALAPPPRLRTTDDGRRSTDDDARQPLEVMGLMLGEFVDDYVRPRSSTRLRKRARAD